MFTDRRVNSLGTRRERQPWPSGKPFRILSLDGGGIRGVYTAEILRRCEEAFCHGAPLARHFDMIAGTSTGGIIALGLGLGIPTAEIAGFYRDDGRRIFPPPPGGWAGKARLLFTWLRGPKLMHEELETALKAAVRRTPARRIHDATGHSSVHDAEDRDRRFQDRSSQRFQERSPDADVEGGAGDIGRADLPQGA